MRRRVFTRSTIRKAVSLLLISARPIERNPFHYRLFVLLPHDYELLDQHPLQSPGPPEGMSAADYDWMKPVYRVMREARKRHLMFRAIGIFPRLQDRLRAKIGRMPTEAEIVESYRAFLLEDMLAMTGGG
uniref:Uncharacterized protein n=1 Tax=Caulobacter sp. (strain K31) TaxID=366602 RepID=B0SZH8_CAUSK|nr:hypothetical protein [uncultured Caulobacter sp.]